MSNPPFIPMVVFAAQIMSLSLLTFRRSWIVGGWIITTSDNSKKRPSNPPQGSAVANFSCSGAARLPRCSAPLHQLNR
ncbi:hypothetical protein C8Q74DRAFT_1274763 [Fomes fomentarius]|nr:hypothetical protein C8Q74DRAFT_1274763 [Fomes fomentarius]